jgi:hypothetical protein
MACRRMSLATAGEFLDLDQLDPEFARAMQEQEEQLRGVDTGLFPPECRRAIYRFLIQQIRRWDKDVPIYISTDENVLASGSRTHRFWDHGGASSVAAGRPLRWLAPLARIASRSPAAHRHALTILQPASTPSPPS